MGSKGPCQHVKTNQDTIVNIHERRKRFALAGLPWECTTAQCNNKNKNKKPAQCKAKTS